MLDYQEYTTQIDHHQGNGNGNGNGYNHLEGDWALFYKVAKGFTHRTPFRVSDTIPPSCLFNMGRLIQIEWQD